jgi:hypothetical protein
MTSKFEQLIEYVINDDEQKARELFHNIVVEKSREIYENLMNEEDGEESEELDEEEDIEEGMDDTSGSATEDVMREVQTDQDGGMNEEDDADAEFDDEAEDDGEDMTKDIEHDHDDDAGEEDLEDRVVDLEDKLDELMAEFEALMGDEEAEHGGDDFDMDPVDGEVGGDAYADDDTSEFDEEEADMGVMENISLQKVAPAKMGDNGANTKSPTTFNSGAAGMQGKPVRNVASEANPDGTSAYKAPNSYADKGRGDLPGAGSFKNVPAKGGANAKLAAAPKPHLAQAAGVNTKTPFPKG